MAGEEIELHRPVGAEGAGLSGLDARLLELFSQKKSAEEVYAELGAPSGLTPARCLQRVREILNSKNALSQIDQKGLLLLDLVRLRDILFDRVEGEELKINRHGDVVEVSSSSAWASALIRLLREWRTTIESMQRDVDHDRAVIQEAHGRAMMAAIGIMFDRLFLRVEQFVADHKRMPSRAEMNEMMEEVMPLGFDALQRAAA